MSNRANCNSEEAILKAAEVEFLERGFDGARTTSIAERAGVTHAMLHYYFRTKEQLFDRIIEAKFNLLAESVLQMLADTSLPLRERLVQGIGRHFDFLVENPLLPRFLTSEADRLQPEVVFKFLPKTMATMQEVQKEIEVDVRHLMLDILSLNAFPFIALPLIDKIGFFEQGRNQLLESIKQENINIILKRLDL